MKINISHNTYILCICSDFLKIKIKLCAMKFQNTKKYFMITYKHVNMYVYMYVSPYISTNIPLQAKSNQVFYSLCVWKILKQKFSGAIRKENIRSKAPVNMLHLSSHFCEESICFFLQFFFSLFCFIIKLIFKATSPKLNKNQSHSISRKK